MGDLVVADESLSSTKILDFSTQDCLDENRGERDEPYIVPDELAHSGGEVVSRNEVKSLQNGSHGIAGEDESHFDVDIKEVDSHSVQGTSKKSTGVNKTPVGLEADGFQELKELGQEFEDEELANRKVEGEATEGVAKPVLAKPPPKRIGVLNSEHRKSVVKEKHVGSGPKIDAKPLNLEAIGTTRGGHSTAQTSKVRISSSSGTLSKIASRIVARTDDGDSKKKKNVGEGTKVEGTENISSSIGPSRSNFTIPQPFALATDKRASIGGRPADDHTRLMRKPHRLSETPGSLAAKTSQVSKVMAPKLVVVKSLHSESMKRHEDSLAKHHEDSMANPITQIMPKNIDDEVQSVSSVQSGPKDPKAKANGSMSAIAFGLRCDKRAEKRKEFYTKLEEKNSAKEEEKNQMQAQTKEEIEAEIRQLRKSLTFKATPMPSFYQDGVPQKVEPRKIPPTRAKSPKLGRRNSCAGLSSLGVTSPLCPSTGPELEQISSDSLLKSADENGGNVSGKNKKFVRKSLSKLPTERFLKSKLPESLGVAKPHLTCTVDSDSALANGSTVSVRHELDGSCTGEGKPEEDFDGPVNEYDGIVKLEAGVPFESQEHHVVLSAEDKNSEAGPVCGLIDTAVEEVKGKDNSLNSRALQKSVSCRVKGILSSDSKSGIKLKTGRVSPSATNEDTQEVNGKATKYTKREHLKASTPSFRSLKKENGSAKHTMKNDHDLTPVITDVSVCS